MSSISRMRFGRSEAVARTFGAHASTYEAHAELQRAVARRLAELLPELSSPRVLELGCGTGLFSRQLLDRYPGGCFVITDLAPAMVERCRTNLGALGVAKTRFAIMDGANPTIAGPFDLIASSMTLHWLPDLNAALARLHELLAPGGSLVYATVGPRSFPEWRDVLGTLNLRSGLLDIPPLPGAVDEECIVIDADALSFLRRLKAIGGLTPREGYRPLSAAALRRALRLADQRHGGRITWHIVYGRLAA